VPRRANKDQLFVFLSPPVKRTPIPRVVSRLPQRTHRIANERLGVEEAKREDKRKDKTIDERIPECKLEDARK